MANTALTLSERLRAIATDPDVKDRDYDADLIEGADEIERMRKALETIESMKTWPNHQINTVTLSAARAFARAALSVAPSEGKP